jgi:hypothetical protein
MEIKIILLEIYLLEFDYGNTGYGVSSLGSEIKRFLPKNQHAKRK